MTNAAPHVYFWTRAWARVTRPLSPDYRLVAAVWAFFFVSGACGLLYQVVWTRKLVLLFGTTSYAVSTVLAIFFAGLGAGSLWGGRLADRTQRPLRLYGIFEILIGLWALAFIVLIDSGESAVAALLRLLSFSHAAGIASRAALALAFLIVPVTLMGATLPLLARFVSCEERSLGGRIGALYAMNTFGAVAGCFCTGFYLLPQLGYTRATLLGVAGNTVIGMSAMFLARATIWLSRVPAHVEEMGRIGPMGPIGRLRVVHCPELPDPETRNPKPAQAPSTPLLDARLAVTAFAISGFCALALEVVWTRLLTLVFLGTTYAFTTMLTTLLCGIAAGSAAAALLVDRCRHRILLLGCIEMAFGAACLWMLPVFAGLPARLAAMQLETGYQWAGEVQSKFILSFIVLFAPTFFSGMTFPFVVRIVTGDAGRVGRDVARLYSANTFGGVLGALAGGFFLIPMLGTHRAIEVLAIALVSVGAGLVLFGTAQRRAYRTAALAAGIGAAILAMILAPHDVSRALNASYISKDNSLLHYREGVEGTVAVSAPAGDDSGSNRVLWINGVQATASIEKGVKMNRFQGVLPLLFDRAPRLALFMCFGSGITAGTLGLYDFDRIDAVEISRDVLEAAPLFATDNFNVAANPKLRFIVDDGRNFLLTTRNRYDAITFEPMPLALAGVSTFYTQEYYRLCLERLAPGGLVSQWVPLHSLDSDTVRSLTRTFVSVFPECCAWFINADLFLIGSNRPLHVDYTRATERLARPEIRRALEEIGGRFPIFGSPDSVNVHAENGEASPYFLEVLACFFMDNTRLRKYAEGGVIMTDDRPWAEFVAPKLMYRRTVEDSLKQLAPFYESPAVILQFSEKDAGRKEEILAKVERRFRARVKDIEGLKLYYGGVFGTGPDTHFKQALAIDPDDANAAYYLKEITLALANRHIEWKETEKAIECLTDALAHAPREPELHLKLADIYFDLGKLDDARQHYRDYLSLGGAAPHAQERAR